VSALILGMLGLIGWLGVGSSINPHRGIFLVIFSFLVGLAACWFGLTAMRQAHRAGSLRPLSSVLGTVFGVIAAVISAFILIGFALFWQQLNTYSTCMNSASTLNAQQACKDQLQRTSGINSF
jgi:hypothetical protein